MVDASGNMKRRYFWCLFKQIRLERGVCLLVSSLPPFECKLIVISISVGQTPTHVKKGSAQVFWKFN
jgi:hypothetical protein